MKDVTSKEAMTPVQDYEVLDETLSKEISQYAVNKEESVFAYLVTASFTLTNKPGPKPEGFSYTKEITFKVSIRKGNRLPSEAELISASQTILDRIAEGHIELADNTPTIRSVSPVNGGDYDNYPTIIITN